MKVYLTLFCFFCLSFSRAQTVVYDHEHFLIVNENAMVRDISEKSYQESLEDIRTNTDNIGLYLSSLTMLERMVYHSLTQVNAALKDAIQVKIMGRTLERIFGLAEETLDMAAQNPVLLLFAETYIRRTKEKSVALVAEISSFVLAESDQILINPNVRDELLGIIHRELAQISAYLLAVRNAMYWAKSAGVLKSLNPYQQYISDLYLINQIMAHKNLLK